MEVEAAEKGREEQEKLHPGKLFTQTVAAAQREGDEGLFLDELATAVQEPLWVEDLRIGPILLVKVHGVEVGDDGGTLGDGVPSDHSVSRCSMENPQRGDVTESQDLVEDGLGVWHSRTIF